MTVTKIEKHLFRVEFTVDEASLHKMLLTFDKAAVFDVQVRAVRFKKANGDSEGPSGQGISQVVMDYMDTREPGQGTSINDIQKGTAIRRSNLHQCLFMLAKAGQLKRLRNGIYARPEP